MVSPHKPISMTEMRSRARKFVHDWAGEERENAEAQSWWNDFFEVFGVARRQVATFERWATRASTGQRGRIDVFMPRVMIAEHKSLGKDGGAAAGQAMDYLRGGDIAPDEFPRYIVSCDFGEIELIDLESDDAPLRFPLGQLPKHVAKFAFLGGYDAPRRAPKAAEKVSIKVAKQMAKLQDALYPRDINPDDPDADHDEMVRAIFMTRILFLLYADDVVGLWENKELDRYLRNHTVEDGSDTGRALQDLFQVLDTPREKRSPNMPDDLARFPYVNGGLFEERIDVPFFTRDMRDALLDAVEIDWSEISPAIFGSLFQGLSTREERRDAGEHYTTEKNILKTIRPLFLDELEERLQEAWNSKTQLAKLRDHLGELRFLDPACGCGNFLIVAYREVADLEFRIIKRTRELDGETARTFAAFTNDDLRVTPDQFAGIEISWWPAKIAETAMFLTEHMVTQRLEEIGDPPSILPIRRAATIVHANALRVDWSEAIEATERTYVFGNPPFGGARVIKPAQAEDLRAAWGDRWSGSLDYASGWFTKAAHFFGEIHGRFAFVATSSVAQGDQAGPTFGPLLDDGWAIDFAYRSFKWESEASGKAAVHCVIAGLARDAGKERRLWSSPARGEDPLEERVPSINTYLAPGPRLDIVKRTAPLSRYLPPVNYGSQPNDGGNLLVSAEEVEEVRKDPVAQRYLRRIVGARELIHDEQRWCLWLVGITAQELRQSRVLVERVERVREIRSESKREATRELAATPTLFGWVNQPDVEYVCIPAHFSEHREFATVARLGPEIINSNANFSAEDPDGLLFGLISSSMFMAWQRTVGGRLKSDLRFSSTLVWNNFPVPELPDARRRAIIDAGKAVEAARAEHPSQSLADLYDPLAMPSNLRDAHVVLDRAVDASFGFRKKPTEADRLARLFESYASLTGADA